MCTCVCETMCVHLKYKKKRAALSCRKLARLCPCRFPLSWHRGGREEGEVRSHRRRGDGCLPWTSGGAGRLLVPAGTQAKLTNKAHSESLAACPRKAAATGPRSHGGPSWEQAAGAAQVTDAWARGQAAGAQTGSWRCGLAAFGDAPWELWALEGPGQCGWLCHPWFPEHWPRHERRSAILRLACPGLRACPLGGMGCPCTEAWSRVGQAGQGHWGSRGQRPCPGMQHAPSGSLLSLNKCTLMVL